MDSPLHPLPKKLMSPSLLLMLWVELWGWGPRFSSCAQTGGVAGDLSARLALFGGAGWNQGWDGRYTRESGFERW